MYQFPKRNKNRTAGSGMRTWTWRTRTVAAAQGIQSRVWSRTKALVLVILKHIDLIALFSGLFFAGGLQTADLWGNYRNTTKTTITLGKDNLGLNQWEDFPGITLCVPWREAVRMDLQERLTAAIDAREADYAKCLRPGEKKVTPYDKNNWKTMAPPCSNFFIMGTRHSIQRPGFIPSLPQLLFNVSVDVHRFVRLEATAVGPDGHPWPLDMSQVSEIAAGATSKCFIFFSRLSEDYRIRFYEELLRETSPRLLYRFKGGSGPMITYGALNLLEIRLTVDFDKFYSAVPLPKPAKKSRSELAVTIHSPYEFKGHTSNKQKTIKIQRGEVATWDFSRTLIHRKAVGRKTLSRQITRGALPRTNYTHLSAVFRTQQTCRVELILFDTLRLRRATGNTHPCLRITQQDSLVPWNVILDLKWYRLPICTVDIKVGSHIRYTWDVLYNIRHRTIKFNQCPYDEYQFFYDFEPTLVPVREQKDPNTGVLILKPSKRPHVNVIEDWKIPLPMFIAELCCLWTLWFGFSFIGMYLSIKRTVRPVIAGAGNRLRSLVIKGLKFTKKSRGQVAPRHQDRQARNDVWTTGPSIQINRIRVHDLHDHKFHFSH